MQTKRSRRNIWKFIDSIILLLPFIFLLVSFIILCGQQFVSLSDDVNNTFQSFWNVDVIVDNIDSLVLDFNNYFLDWGHVGGFGYDLYSIISKIISFFFIEDGAYTGFIDNNLLSFICNYFVYAICYEFISLLINIIMWLPRWARNKFNESGD